MRLVWPLLHLLLHLAGLVTSHWQWLPCCGTFGRWTWCLLHSLGEASSPRV